MPLCLLNTLAIPLYFSKNKPVVSTAPAITDKLFAYAPTATCVGSHASSNCVVLWARTDATSFPQHSYSTDISLMSTHCLFMSS